MIDIKKYGYYYDEVIPDGLMAARITQVQKSSYRIVCEQGYTSAVLKGSFLHEAQLKSEFPVIGDFVWVEYNPLGDSRIIKVLPRKTKFSRPDFLGGGYGGVKTSFEQIVASNFDYVFIISSLNQDFNLGRISRYLSAVRQSGAVPVILLSKVDLCEDYWVYEEETAQMAKGVAVICLSSHTGFGIERLQKYLQPEKTVVFLGMSGVGKSSLVNRIAGSTVMVVGGIRQDDDKGRHTTTYRQMIQLESGCLVIDTPGMREIGMYDAEEGIERTFEDIETLSQSCRFSDCGHDTEPGCAVRAAIEEGSLSLEQWKRYNSQKRENEFIQQKLARKMKKRKGMK